MTAGEKVYFVVGVTATVVDPKTREVARSMNVFEFTKGRVYFELIDESKLPFYQKPILIAQEKENNVLDNIEDTIKFLKGYYPQLEKVKDGDKIKVSLDSELKRLKEKYNIS